MKLFATTFLFLIACCALSTKALPPVSAAVPAFAEHVFIPFGFYYVGGQFANAETFPKYQFDTMEACKDKLKMIVGSITLKAGEGNSMIGGCVPALKLDPHYAPDAPKMAEPDGPK